MNTVIYMKSVPGKPLYRALTRPLKLKTIDNRYTEIPINFEWDGSSVPWIFNGLFPRHRHPIASCRHDWRCLHAKNWYERKWADKQFEIDVGNPAFRNTSTNSLIRCVAFPSISPRVVG